MHKSCLLLPILVLATPAWGEEHCNPECPELYVISDPVQRLPETEIVLVEPSPHDWIVVSGGHLWKPISERALSVRYIDGPDQSAGQRVENIIRAQPGWQQFRRSDARSANPTSQGITSRGLGGNASSRALLTLDGIPQTDPFGGWINWTAFDAVQLRGIRIENGGGSGTEGAGALAGTIQLSSVRWPKHSGSIAYGSRGSVDVDASSGADLGDGHVLVSGNYSRGDGFIPIVASQRGPVDGRAGYESFGGGLRLVAPLTSWGNGPSVEANIRGFDDRRSRGLPFSNNRNSGVDASVRVLKNDGDVDVLALAYVQVRDFASQFNAVAANRASVTPTLDQFSVPSTGIGARLELRPKIGTYLGAGSDNDRQLRLGIDWRQTSGRTRENSNYVAGVATRYREAGGDTGVVGLFSEWSALLGGLDLSAAGRIDHWSLTGGRRYEANIGGAVRSNDIYSDRTGWEPTGRVAANWHVADTVSVIAAGYTGWRLPTLNELYRPFRAGADATAANEALQPERLWGGEIRLESGLSGVELNLTAFSNRLDNAIANVTMGQGAGTFPGVGFVAAGGAYRQRQNLDAIVSQGVELDADVKVTKNLRAGLGYSYVDAKERGRGSALALNGLRPAQTMRHSGNVRLSYNGMRMQSDVQMRYIGRQFEDDGNLRTLNNVITVDANVVVLLAAEWRLVLRAENLMDQRVEAAISSIGIIERATPRTIWIGLRFDVD